MRIILPSFSLKPGGGFRALINLATVLADSQHEVELFIVEAAALPYQIDPRITVTVAQYPYRSSGWRFLKALNLMERAVHTADLVIVNFFGALYPASMAKLIGNVKRVLFWIQTDDPYLFGKLVPAARGMRALKYAVARGSYLLQAERYCVSNYLAARLHDRYGLRCEVLYPPIDTATFHSLPKSSTSPILACMGWQAPYKGLPLILQTFQRVIKTFPQARLRIITADQNLVIPDAQVETINPTTDHSLVEALAGSSLLLHASSFEGFGLPPVEAMACGVPVVALQAGGVADYLVNGVNCLCCNEPSPDALAEAAVALLSNASLTAELISAGLTTVQRFALTTRRPAILEQLRLG